MRANTTTTKAEGFTTKVPITIWSLTIEDTIYLAHQIWISKILWHYLSFSVWPMDT